MKGLGGGLADKCVARTFWDCEHGWAAARGDWTNPRIAAAAEEAMAVSSRFVSLHTA
jgi:hypothetical protein